jgi:predicted polyphosphate/ATP-dependent NAD kinase
MNIGFIINPWAGVGGSVALKGSDGAVTRAEALARGAIPRAQDRAAVMLQAFLQHWQTRQAVTWFTAPDDMGETVLRQQLSSSADIRIQPRESLTQTEAEHTEQAVAWCLKQNVSLIVFAGGDGTARDICRINAQQVPVIGIPAGVKIHSGVFAVTPHAAGEVLAGLLNGELTELRLDEVRDIDEDAFRENKVRSRYYGEMKIPIAGMFMQHVKVGGVESDALVLNDIAEWLIESFEENTTYFIGSGKSTATVMAQMQLPNTLLGVDAIRDGELIQADCTEADILRLLNEAPAKLVISIIGGQGHIFGRGNAQFSATVLEKIEKDNVLLIGSKNKLKTLNGKPLLVDTGSIVLDQAWAGLIPVLTGYDNAVLYPVAAL